MDPHASENLGESKPSTQSEHQDQTATQYGKQQDFEVDSGLRSALGDVGSHLGNPAHGDEQVRMSDEISHGTGAAKEEVPTEPPMFSSPTFGEEGENVSGYVPEHPAPVMKDGSPVHYLSDSPITVQHPIHDEPITDRGYDSNPTGSASPFFETALRSDSPTSDKVVDFDSAAPVTENPSVSEFDPFGSEDGSKVDTEGLSTFLPPTTTSAPGVRDIDPNISSSPPKFEDDLYNPPVDPIINIMPAPTVDDIPVPKVSPPSSTVAEPPTPVGLKDPAVVEPNTAELLHLVEPLVSSANPDDADDPDPIPNRPDPFQTSPVEVELQSGGGPEEKESSSQRNIPTLPSMETEPPSPPTPLTPVAAAPEYPEPQNGGDEGPARSQDPDPTAFEQLLGKGRVQEVMEDFIPPAPDKPLPPTPGSDSTYSFSSKPEPAVVITSCLQGLRHVSVMELLLWRDPKKSGVAFATGLIVLISMLYFSFISVVAYLSLSILTVTLGFRLYKSVMATVQKTNEGHPFQDLLSIDTTITEEKGHEMADKVVAEMNCMSGCLKDLFLVKDVFESVKFGFCLYLLTYVGACFNTMTLIIMAYVALFTLPKVYEMNKTQIDQVLAQVKEKMAEISSKVKAAIPVGKKPAAEVTEEKKEE